MFARLRLLQTQTLSNLNCCNLTEVSGVSDADLIACRAVHLYVGHNCMIWLLLHNPLWKLLSVSLLPIHTLGLFTLL